MNDRRHSVLVIGATGTQGSAAVRELLRRGHRVRALTRDPARARGLSRLGADLVRGDLADRHSIEAALRVRPPYSPCRCVIPPTKKGS